ncbi:MAG: aldo/keto reductase [Planctomycetota bacterium]|nr:aldo/keto reductase [Planctomycetota bacterium]
MNKSMKARPFGRRSGLKVAPVSIGAMRFPQDVTDAVALIRRAIDAGMRYIDTSRGYGESEFVLGRALKDGYRKKVILSTKCSPWTKKVRDDDTEAADCVLRRIEESITRLDVEYLDFYQVWNLSSAEAWQAATKKGGMVDGIRKAMKRGLVKHTGLTTHDSPQSLLENLPQADWCEVVLASYNLLNTAYEPVLARARELGMGTIVMNPVGGGKLTEESAVLKRLARKVGATSVADLAVRFVLANPNVDTILCGMNRPGDVDATVASAHRPAFTAEQVAAIRKFLAERTPKSVGFCTACNYCMPCPKGLPIPAIMGAIYEHRFLGFKAAARSMYQWCGPVKADACSHCRQCEPKCTQKLKISDEMTWAAKTLAPAK